MRRLLIAIGLTLAACVSAPGTAETAAPFTLTANVSAPPPEAEPATLTWPGLDLPAGEYRLDPRHASVNFRIRHQGLAWFTGRFDTVAASINLDPADPSQSHLDAQIDATSVDTGVASAFDRQIASALGAQTSPISVTSTSVTRTGEFTGEMSGDLTMNGQTHPATFAITYDGGHTDPLRGGAVALGFSAHATIDRSQWGVTQWSMFAGKDVQLVIEAEFVKV